MHHVHAIRDDSRLLFRKPHGPVFWSLLIAVCFCGCHSVDKDKPTSEGLDQETVLLKAITAERGQALLADLGLGIIASAADPNTLLLSGPPDELKKASVVLDLIDTDEPYVIESLAPATMARTLPSNRQIANAIGQVDIGTFAALPDPDEARRAIIDIQGETIVAIVPANLWPQVRAVVEFGPETARLRKDIEADSVQNDRVATGEPAGTSPASSTQPRSSIGSERGPTKIRAVEIVSQLTDFGEPDAESQKENASPPQSSAPQDKITPVKPRAIREDTPNAEPATTAASELDDEMSRGVLKPTVETSPPPQSRTESASVAFPDGNDVIELTLPEKINLAQLIDLVGEYLHLDCMYDAERIGNQVITLKLHSKLRSEITVKDLYSLLETILKFRGLVMTRYEGNLAIS